jgi:hypothetical protein
MPFSAGRVLARSLVLLRANLGTFLALAVVLFAPVFAVALIVTLGGPAHPGTMSDGAPRSPALPPLAAQFLVGILVFVAQYLLAGALAWAVTEQFHDRRPSPREILVRGVQRLLSVVDVAFVTGVLVGAGFFLLVVPGVLLTLVFFVAVPVAVMEEKNVLGALRRSRALTEGHRSELFVILLATLGLLFAAGLLLPGAFAAAGPGVAIVVATLAQTLIGLYAGVCQTVAYHDLCTIEGGARPDAASGPDGGPSRPGGETSD